MMLPWVQQRYGLRGRTPFNTSTALFLSCPFISPGFGSCYFSSSIPSKNGVSIDIVLGDLPRDPYEGSPMRARQVTDTHLKFKNRIFPIRCVLGRVSVCWARDGNTSRPARCVFNLKYMRKPVSYSASPAHTCLKPTVPLCMKHLTLSI
ncbi:hypothetical protein BDM02DRAFT_2889090 [Thelephora ganbajun]|uniref:Uncharacterized protein n=1 Tax=Thelephora ganbajun TaxID=370292 RepID=A0ACB6ZB90_THEGA|nr:hypothetical protein BDM02DRAFT_2889090 [Thelephora ganbajun]